MAHILCCPMCFKTIPMFFIQCSSAKIQIKYKCKCDQSIPSQILLSSLLKKIRQPLKEQCIDHQSLSEKYCPDCQQWKCITCLQNHSSSHTTLLTKPLNLICSNHKQSFSQYCFACDENLCSNCLKDHLIHKKIALDTINTPNNTLKKSIIALMKKNDEILAYFINMTIQDHSGSTLKLQLMQENVQKLLGDYHIANLDLLDFVDYLDATISICKDYPCYQLIHLKESIKINNPIDFHSYEDYEDKYFVIQYYLRNEFVIQNEYQSQAVLKKHINWVRQIIQLNDGQLASSSNDKTIKLWNVDSFTCNGTLTGHTNWILKMIELSSGNIASFGLDRIIFVWDTKSYTYIAKLHDLVVSIQDIIPLSNERMISTAENSNTIKLWDIKTCQIIQDIVLADNVIAMMIKKSDGNMITVTSNNIQSWDMMSLKCKGTFKDQSKEKIYSYSLLELPNGDIVTYGPDNNTKIWNEQSFTCKFVIKHRLKLNKLFLLRDDLLIYFEEKMIEVFNFKTGQLTTKIKIQSFNHWRINDGLIIMMIEKKVMTMTSTITFAFNGILIGHNRIVNDVIQLKDGRIASCSDDYSIRLWKIQEK